MTNFADTVLHSGRITTCDPSRPHASAVAVRDRRFVAVGDQKEVMSWAGPQTEVIDLHGRNVIPGLIDSHIHLIRGGLTFNIELRWDGVPSVVDALALLRLQAERTPAPQWVRVVGGFSQFQFAEQRLPTLDELNAAAPDTPVFVLHLYDRALLNRAALRATGYTRETPDPPGGRIQRDHTGEPTGLLVAEPNATILYATLDKAPKLDPEDQVLSTRHFMRELNRLGVTSAVDAGGGSQQYPEDYDVIETLHREDLLTVRMAYHLFTQRPEAELDDFQQWTATVQPGQGDETYRLNGAGEMLVYSAADFEDFAQPRPDLARSMEGELEPVVRHLVEQRWPWRLHATYDESISRALDVFERVDRDIPFAGLRWIVDHAETVTDRNLERIAALGGGIAVQHRMAFQGEAFVQRYGSAAAERTPPLRRILATGIPLGVGTDATRVADHNPWRCLHWLVTGATVGGAVLYPEANRLTREEALRQFATGNAWFTGEEDVKGAIRAGQYADLAVLTADYFSVDAKQIPALGSVLTLMGGRVVHGSEEFTPLAPALPPARPDWSPRRSHTQPQISGASLS